MELIAWIGKDNVSWGQIAGVINKGEWESIVLVGNESGKTFNCEKDFEFIELKSQGLTELKDELLKKLKGKFKGTEVGLSIASGNGKEHMALISSLLSLPVGIRFSALTKDGIIFM